jgi:hypothetical protein
MTVHFLHIGKTGGTAIKSALHGAGLGYFKPENAHKFAQTDYGGIQLHDHGYWLEHVPPGEHAIFFVRDPISRMISGFQSRLRKGQPRYYSEWSPAEREAFEVFPTPERLAHGLVSENRRERRLARRAMRRIFHLRFMERFTGPPDYVRSRLDDILYIGRQETIDADWRQIKRLLDLPRRLELPTDPVRAHRRDPLDQPQLDAVAVAALKDWYTRDYRLVEFCDEIRAERGWAVASSGFGFKRRRRGSTLTRADG